MTYFQFLLYFLVAPIVVLLLLSRRHLTRYRWLTIGALMAIALIYTTPWDNYLVANEIWWYSPSQVTGLTLGWVPIEEYTFFLLQPLFTGLLLLTLRRFDPPQGPLKWGNRPANRWILALVALWGTSIAVLLFGSTSTTYLGLELSWALPPLILQLAFGGELLLGAFRSAGLALVGSTLYFTLADVVAIEAGIWTIHPSYTLGLNPLPSLVLEEAVFFALTNALVIGGLTLLWHPDSASRWSSLKDHWLGSRRA
ncbi:MAG: lycopene cyclase domain-containing protein [Anaerolineales bacterium]